MRKIVLGLVATAAIAAPLAFAGAASANVAVDNGVGHIDKSDIQAAFKWNNGDFDKAVGSLKFTAGRQVMGNETRWQCSDGSIQSQTSLVTQNRTVTPKALLSSNGKQITGWDMTGMGYEYVSGVRAGAPYVGFCGSGYATGFLPNVFTTDVTDGDLKVTGTLNDVTKNVTLPNTPVAPVV